MGGAFWVSIFNSTWLGPHWWNSRGDTGLSDWGEIEVFLFRHTALLWGTPLGLELNTSSLQGLVRKKLYSFFLGNLPTSIHEMKVQGNGMKGIERHEGRCGEIKLNEGMGYDTKTKTIPKGLENAIHYHYPLGISFLRSNPVPPCPTSSRLDLKRFPITGLVRKKYTSCRIWGIFQLQWHERN